MNQIQSLYLELLKPTNRNELEGEKVHESLVSNQNLWQSAIFLRLNSLIALRDMSQGINNSDTLFIIPKDGCEAALEELAATWDADEIDYLSPEETSDLLGSWGPSMKTKVLRVWWD